MSTVNPRRARRILGEIKQLTEERAELEKQGIYVHIPESDISTLLVYIEGPADDMGVPTPYFGGCYFFEITYPDNYPFEPLKIRFFTRDAANIRLHPNFYTCGKVCLSSINTFGSNDWTATRTAMGEILNLRARLDACPIRYEPGYETTPQSNIDRFNLQYTYGNFRCAVISMITNTPSPFRVFFQRMRDNFMRNYTELKARAERQYVISQNVDYGYIIQKIDEIHMTFTMERAVLS